MQRRAWTLICLIAVLSTGLLQSSTVQAAGRPHVLPPGLLVLYKRALVNVEHCFPLAPRVEPAIRAMQRGQHIHALNRSDGVQSSRERDALTALDRRLQKSCAYVLDISPGDLTDDSSKSIHALAVALNGWIDQTRTVQVAMQACEVLGNYYNVHDVRCVPPLVAHIAPYLRSYRHAQQVLRAFRATWHLK